MRVTPLDLRQQQFKTVLRGYDRGEVTSFLLEVADDYETALREHERMRLDVERLQAVLDEHRGQEKNLQNTLLTAQKLADEIREVARQDAARIVREAEGRSDLLLQQSQARLDDVQRAIDDLRHKRRDVEASVESIIATLQNTIAFVREQDGRHRDEKILPHPLPARGADAAPEQKTTAVATDATTDAKTPRTGTTPGR